MAANDDPLDLQVADRVLDHARRAEIVGRDDVGDVAVHEDVAGLAVADGGLGDAAVGAAYPENLWGLAGREAFEEGGVRFGGSSGEGLVPGEDALEGV